MNKEIKDDNNDYGRIDKHVGIYGDKCIYNSLQLQTIHLSVVVYMLIKYA